MWPINFIAYSKHTKPVPGGTPRTQPISIEPILWAALLVLALIFCSVVKTTPENYAVMGVLIFFAVGIAYAIRREVQFHASIQPEPKQPEPLSAPSPAPEWTAADVSTLRAFLQTPTGQSLLKRGHAQEFNTAISACQDPMHTVHSAARAAGFSDAIQWLESLASDQMLSRLTGDQVKNTDAQEQNDLSASERRSF